MALINCPECGKPNQSDRGTCTGCGMNILEWRREEKRKAELLEWERERERQRKLEKELEEKKEREYGDTKPCLGAYQLHSKPWLYKNGKFEGCPNRVSIYASGVGSAWCDTCKHKFEEDSRDKWIGVYNSY